jgi:transcription antitermination factor NusG
MGRESIETPGFWGLVMTKPRCSAVAAENLMAQSFLVYDPQIAERVVSRGRVVLRKAQLFPGYLFVLITDQFRCISGTYGVIALVMNGDRPSKIRTEELEKIRQQEIDGVVSLPERTKFRMGQPVEAKSGVMINRVGIYAGDRKNDRVKVLYQMLGREAPVYVREQDLIEA